MADRDAVGLWLHQAGPRAVAAERCQGVLIRAAATRYVYMYAREGPRWASLDCMPLGRICTCRNRCIS